MTQIRAQYEELRHLRKALHKLEAEAKRKHLFKYRLKPKRRKLLKRRLDDYERLDHTRGAGRDLLGVDLD